MPELSMDLTGDGFGVWPDLLQIREAGKLTDYRGPIKVSALAGGMTSGDPSVAFRFDLDDGSVLVAETSMALVLTLADALRARYGDVRMRHP